MTTLTTAPLAPLLNRLFEEAAKASPESSPVLASLSEDEFTRFLRSKTGYLDFYGQLKDVPLEISRETGTRNIVEFGTSFGISTLHLAAALRDNGGGKLITTEFEPSKVARARENLTAGGVIDLVEIRVGDALETLRNNLPESIELLLLDGHKALYLDILNLVESRLRPGTLVVADNADFNPEYVARMRSPVNGYLSTPFGSDVELSLRIG